MKPRLIFFGTGPVSLATLEGIHDAFDIEAIITKPDRIAPSGRTHDHPVKRFGGDLGVPVHQVADGQMLEELFTREPFVSRLGLVVDFGMIITPEVIDYFDFGIINSHFSLLPLLRGADPISFAILEGLAETGVSLMKIVAAMDAGPLISQEKTPVSPTATTPELTRELTEISNHMLKRDLPRYLAGELRPSPQDPDITPTYTRKLTKADGVIDWNKPAVQLEREVRALTPWPGSHTSLHGREVIVTAAHVDGDKLVIDRLKPAGKREMSLAEFERGLH